MKAKFILVSAVPVLEEDCVEKAGGVPKTVVRNQKYKKVMIIHQLTLEKAAEGPALSPCYRG